MKAAIFHEVNQPLSIEEVQIDKPKAREVLVRTAATGVCHSDLHFIQGLYPIQTPVILGHESAGVVEAVGADVSYVQPGDHVITCLSAFCGHCDYCLEGRMSLCESPELQRTSDAPPRLSQHSQTMGQFMHLSSFAEQMLIHEHALVKVTKEIPFDRAALLGCGVLTGVGAVFHTAAVEPGAKVAVFGCGGVGLSCINGAAIAGAGQIIAIDPIPEKLELAQTFGATDVINATTIDSVSQIREWTQGGVHYAFEAVGLKITTEQAFRALRPGGTATIIGMIPVGTKVELHGPEFLREKKIQGSYMGSNRFRIDMPRLIDFYMGGKLKLDEMISKRIPLAQINQAMEELQKGHVTRSVIVFEQ